MLGEIFSLNYRNFVKSNAFILSQSRNLTPSSKYLALGFRNGFVISRLDYIVFLSKRSALFFFNSLIRGNKPCFALGSSMSKVSTSLVKDLFYNRISYARTWIPGLLTNYKNSLRYIKKSKDSFNLATMFGFPDIVVTFGYQRGLKDIVGECRTVGLPMIANVDSSVNLRLMNYFLVSNLHNPHTGYFLCSGFLRITYSARHFRVFRFFNYMKRYVRSIYLRRTLFVKLKSLKSRVKLTFFPVYLTSGKSYNNERINKACLYFFRFYKIFNYSNANLYHINFYKNHLATQQFRTFLFFRSTFLKILFKRERLRLLKSKIKSFTQNDFSILRSFNHSFLNSGFLETQRNLNKYIYKYLLFMVMDLNNSNSLINHYRNIRALLSKFKYFFLLKHKHFSFRKIARSIAKVIIRIACRLKLFSKNDLSRRVLKYVNRFALSKAFFFILLKQRIFLFQSILFYKYPNRKISSLPFRDFRNIKFRSKSDTVHKHKLFKSSYKTNFIFDLIKRDRFSSFESRIYSKILFSFYFLYLRITSASSKSRYFTSKYLPKKEDSNLDIFSKISMDLYKNRSKIINFLFSVPNYRGFLTKNKLVNNNFNVLTYRRIRLPLKRKKVLQRFRFQQRKLLKRTILKRFEEFFLIKGFLSLRKFILPNFDTYFSSFINRTKRRSRNYKYKINYKRFLMKYAPKRKKKVFPFRGFRYNKKRFFNKQKFNRRIFKNRFKKRFLKKKTFKHSPKLRKR